MTTESTNTDKDTVQENTDVELNQAEQATNADAVAAEAPRACDPDRRRSPS